LFAEFHAPAAKAANGSSRPAHKAAAPQPRRQAAQPAIDSAAVLQRLTGVHMRRSQDRGCMPDSVSLESTGSEALQNLSWTCAGLQLIFTIHAQSHLSSSRSTLYQSFWARQKEKPKKKKKKKKQSKCYASEHCRHRVWPAGRH